MNDIRADIRAILLRHRGRNNAISRRELLEALEADRGFDRKLRLIIGQLRREGVPILFATDQPAGYYLPANQSELQAGMKQLRSYIIDQCRTLRDFRIYGNRYIASEYQETLL